MRAFAKIISDYPSPDKQDKCDNESIFCSNTEKYTFYLTNKPDKYVHKIISAKNRRNIFNVLKCADTPLPQG
jgi:hypothetical protein